MVFLPSLLFVAAAAAASCQSFDQLQRPAPKTYWYEAIKHNGISPFIPDGHDWTVFRNVKDFGAKGDGVTDDYEAFQAAIQFGNATADRRSHSFGTTGQPAVLYIPSGTYMLSYPIQSFVDTVIMGDPINPPVLRATGNFSNAFLWYAKDPNFDATTNFYIAMKNLVLDSTLVPPEQDITLLDWSVSQAVQLTNVVFNMTVGATGHKGLATPEGGSPLIMNDLTFQGGSVGIVMNEQQYHFKGITFKGMHVDIGLKIDKLFEGTGQGLHFESCRIGVDTSNNNTGFFALIDSSAKDVDVVFNIAASPTAQGSIVLENVNVDSSVSSTVSADGVSVLTGSVGQGRSWIWGNVYSPNGHERAEGKFYPASRPGALVDHSGSYYAVKPTTFQDWGVETVINVKDVCGWPVAGDGVTDDTASLQHIINAAAGKKVLFFPHGTYLVSDALFIPPGTRIHGEVWSEISAIGDKFKNRANLVPMVQVGKPGQVGLAQFVDMLFTVADILPGCKLVEVNMAGQNPGDVGFFNTVFRIGGARGSKVHTECDDPATCKAARLCAHLTVSSSSYWENSWCWSADHDLDDDQYNANPSTAGGFLVEATKGTWLSGIGSEHNDLYQMNIYKAKNVYLGFQQSETPYWQGNGSDVLTPQPWEGALLDSDPDFSWCDEDDAQCRMALYQRVAHSTDINVYGGGYWTFFNGINRDSCGSECQQNAVLYEDNYGLYSYGISTHNVRTLLLIGDNGQYRALANDTANSGGWQDGGGVLAAYIPTLG